VTELDADIAALSALHGVQTSYTDGLGRSRDADQDVVVAMLRALGVPLDRTKDAAELVRAQRMAAMSRPVQPVLAYRVGRQDTVTATLPAKTELSDVWVSLEFEDGTTSRARLDQASPTTLPTTNVEVEVETDFEVEGKRFVEMPLDLERVARGPIPPGRHRVTLEGLGVPEVALVVAAPDCPRAPRAWGAFMPLHAVRSTTDWGIGSYGDLGQLGEWVAARGGSFLGGLPLYPSFLDHPADPSPYLPVSRLAYNEVFVDPLTLPEFSAAEKARTLVASAGFAERVTGVRGGALVDYEEVARLKRGVLEPMAEAVCQLPDRRLALEEFGLRHPELVAYAEFRAGLEDPGHNGRPDMTKVRYHLYAQWAAHEQLKRAGEAIGRYADFPVGSHPYGFDPVWSPSSFVPGVHGGSPPDQFFPGGQDWGFHPLHPERIREDGYRFFSAALARAFRHADCLRIDHVMGLQRLFMVPEGFGGQGVYVSYRADEMHALVCLEAHRAGAVVVGEDLGTVPDGVRERMERDHMLRSWVFQFESTAATPLPEPPAETLATLGTHDLPRFGARLWGDDLAADEVNGRLTPEECAEAQRNRTQWRTSLLDALGVPAEGLPDVQVTAAALEGCLYDLARSDAAVVLVDLEELWDERQQQNHPGTGPGGANWRLRAARTLEEFQRDPDVADMLAGMERSAT
jgi:4-alpha-glucanotransferase